MLNIKKYILLKNMIIAKISDGFGNQLFMYACGYTVSKRLHTKLMLDISYLDTNSLRSYELDKLNICFDRKFTVLALKFYPLKVLCRKIAHAYMKLCYKYLYEKSGCGYNDNVRGATNRTYLFGYWQSEKYFSDCRCDLLKMFTPRYELSEGCKYYIEQVRACQSIAIHVRRGDYVALGNCLDTSYYDKAIDIINSQVENPVYYVFSDDLDYAKQIFTHKRGIYKYVEYQSDNLSLDDFFIMKECRHIIMANSSFSWWAAWLKSNADKIVICPKIEQWDGDFYPESWMKL